MYYLKPGRGPSFLGGIGAIAAGMFGIGWTAMAMSIGASPFIVLFGVLFVFLAAGMGAYHFYNATSRNRFSQWDLTTDQEESDPISNMMGYGKQIHFSQDLAEGDQEEWYDSEGQYGGEYCPFCGNKVEKQFDFCPNCGKDI